MALTNIEVLNGSLSLVCVIISILIGSLIISKYTEHKQNILIYMGITWIGIFSPWWPSSVAFIVALITGSGLSPGAYFSLGLLASPAILIIWMIAFTNFKYKAKQKPIVLIYALISIIFEIYLLVVLFILNDPSQIGELTGILDVTYKGFTVIYSIFIVVTLLITGCLFGLESLRSENPEIKLKGRFLISAFIFWSVGAFFDAGLPLNVISLAIARALLISSAFLFYFGFVMPDFIKNRFIK